MKYQKGITFRERVAHLVYGNDPQLINSPTRRDQSILTIEAVIAICGLTLIQGNFLQGLLIYLGATDAVLSFISIVGVVAGASAIFGGYIFEGRQRRKGIIVAMILMARLTCSLVVFMPLLFPKNSPYVIPTIVGVVAFCYVVTALADTGYNSILVGLIPIDSRGRVFAVRNKVMQIVVPVISLTAAAYLDRFGGSYTGFIVIYSIGGILIICEAIMLSRVNEPIYPPSKKFSFKVLPKLLKGNLPFCVFTAEMFLMYVFIYISASFNTMYLMKYNNFSYTLITATSVCSTLVMAFLYSKWGRLSDRVGGGKVLFISILLRVAEALSWVLIPPVALKFLFFVPYALAAAAGSSMTISLFSRKFEIIPEENMTVFIGIQGAVFGGATALGSFLGTQIKQLIENSGNEVLLSGMWQFRFVYLTGAVMMIGLSVFLLMKNKGPKV